MAGQRFSLLARNWRPRKAKHRLELDLVGRIDDEIVFVEVKTRTLDEASSRQPPILAQFSSTKKRNILQAALLFISEHNLWDRPIRFDLVCVTFAANTNPSVEHYCNVIEFGKTLDSSDPTWQPW